MAALAVGFTNVEIISGANAVVQLRAAPAMRGRVLALLSVVFLGSTPIGSPIVGWIAEAVGPRAALAVGAVATGLVVAWIAHAARRRRRHARGRPRNGEADVATADRRRRSSPLAA